MSTNKKSRTKKTGRKKNVLDTDPPILVGGGGSSFIWIRRDLDPQLVTRVPSGAPQPPNPDSYYCFRVQGNIGEVVLDDGNSAPPPGKSVNNQKYFVQFDI